MVSNINFLFHNIWDVILPIDFYIFQDGYCTTNQLWMVKKCGKFQLAMFDHLRISSFSGICCDGKIWKGSSFPKWLLLHFIATSQQKYIRVAAVSRSPKNLRPVLNGSRWRRCSCFLYAMFVPWLVGALEHGFYDFPYFGINHPNWQSYFSEG